MDNDERMKNLHNWFDSKDSFNVFGLGSVCWVLIQIAEILSDILKELRKDDSR